MAGFRIDVAHGLYKDAELRDNPPQTEGNRMDGQFGLRFVYNTNRPVWMGSNHDLGRFPSRWCGGDERKVRLALLLLLATLPGTTVLYYGDEIGMTDVDVPVALRRDHATLAVEQGADRDRARTPMPWDDSPGGGFTSPPVTPWLPTGDHRAGNVAGQRADAGFGALAVPAPARAAPGRAPRRRGRLQEPAGHGEQWAYRVGPLVVAANFSDHPAKFPAAAGEVLLTTARAASPPGVLSAWEGVITRQGR